MKPIKKIAPKRPAFVFGRLVESETTGSVYMVMEDNGNSTIRALLLYNPNAKHQVRTVLPALNTNILVAFEGELTLRP